MGYTCNAHPHEGCSSEIAVVHNGIIENYEELKKELVASGHSFKSETDSEVIAHLLEESYSELHDKVRAIIQVCNKLHGAYLLLLFLATGQLSSARELKSRGATIIGISDKSDEVYDHFIRLPKLISILYPLIEIIPLQLLAYYLALRKNIDPDYPRNLAKSVTVK